MTGSIEARAGRPPLEAGRATRRWWDAAADEYQATHAVTLGRDELVWGPEGLTEDEAGALGELEGRRALEVGCGAGQGSRYARRKGAHTVGLDLSARQLDHARRLDAECGSVGCWVQADATALPFADASFDVAFSAYGAVQFVDNPQQVHAEVARVLRPGGRWAFSVTHPVRWAFLDDPGPRGLTAVRSYFDRSPYVERGPDGSLVYLESHRTLADHVHDLVTHGLTIRQLLEPRWKDGQPAWDAWSPLRGRLLPGTLLLVASQ